jgi:hypothetical protein
VSPGHLGTGITTQGKLFDMKRVIASTAAAAALVVGGVTVTATSATADTPAASIDTTSTGSASLATTLLAGKLGCALGSLFGTTLPNC